MSSTASVQNSPRPKSAIVYTMGKVGSDGIAKALETAGLPTYHIHTLDRERLIQRTLNAVEDNRFPPGHVLASMMILRRAPAEPFYISCVRDPVARNLSAFFQNLSNYGLNASSEPERCASVFASRYKHQTATRWFDQEFCERLKFSLSDLAFDVQSKFVRRSNWAIFRIDCEVTETVLSDVFGAPITVKRRNETGVKAEGALYSATRKILRLDKRLLDELLDSEYSRVFWTDAERREMRLRWQKA